MALVHALELKPEIPGREHEIYKSRTAQSLSGGLPLIISQLLKKENQGENKQVLYFKYFLRLKWMNRSTIVKG